MSGGWHIVFAAGGTGGHLFPALAVGNDLHERHPRTKLTLITDRSKKNIEGLEGIFDFMQLKIPRRSGANAIFFALAMGIAFVKAFLCFLRNRPNLVLGFGGYSSVPAVLAAQVLGIPTIIHEQNAHLGFANRILSQRSKLLALSFKETQGVVSSINTVVTGNPVRIQKNHSYKETSGPFHLFVVGGSQGAGHFSELIPEAFSLISEDERQSFTLTMQCRPEYLFKTTARFAALKMNPTLSPFFKDIESEFSKADFIVARSGASTVSEVSTIGRCALFIPYPYAADDHQYYNAQALGDACFLARQSELSAQDLASYLKNILKDPQVLASKAKAIHKYTMAGAALALSKVVEDFLSNVYVNHD